MEVPSQLFEEFCYNKNILQFMTDDIITDDHIQKLILKKNQFNSIEIANQLVISYVDIHMHSNATINIDTIYSTIYKEIFGFNNILNPIYTLDHIYEGYDSRYYSYLWSNIYSKDIYITKFKDNELNKDLFLDYKNNFLSKIDYINPYFIYKRYMNRDINYNNYFNNM